ncbi:hypothetical protein MAQ5080_01415 [Marinomonas aquimarina]|uniref:Uncharacterized protein n=1 Tax=Marinomonas aquimarina TaxID=295068 RepID=A0A1A8TAE1_9GAMM|nr:hypothetical protein MAQ5080_01415 [Marinomonas aquimarina]
MGKSDAELYKREPANTTQITLLAVFLRFWVDPVWELT